MRRLIVLIFLVVILGTKGLSPLFDVLDAQPACGESEGRVERPGYRSEPIQTNMVYSIYLPPCYDSTDNLYPVLYLMHGSNDDDQHWLRLGLKERLDEAITAGEMPPVIVVLPFGNWVANVNQFGYDSWQNVFLSDLMPLVESDYRIDARRETRAIGGISRGGFWAFNLAFRHPDLFSAVGGHSAFFAERQGPPEHTPLDLATSEAEEIKTLRISLDRGADDYAAPGLDLMHGYLEAAGVPHTYTIHPEGQHANSYWRDHVREYLNFYVAEWGTDEDEAVATDEAGVIKEADEASLVPTIALFVTNTPGGVSPTNSTATPTPAVTLSPTDVATSPLPTGEGVYLFLPAAVFPSLLVSVDGAALRGEFDPKLTVTSETAIVLASYGFNLHPDIQTVATTAELNNLLWRDRTRYTILPFEALTPRYRVLWVDEVHPLDMLDTYPLVFTGDNPNFTPDKLTRIIISGVTALTRDTIPALDTNGIEWAASGIQDYVNRADFFHISNEVSFDPVCPESNGQLLGGPTSFCSKPEHFELFTALDVDIVELSGNHNNDYGYEAYLNTLQWYRDQGMLVVGGGEDVESANTPLILEHNSNRIAWVSCNWVGPYYALANDDETALSGKRPGAASCNYDTLRETLPALDEKNDVLIVSSQYLEFDQHPPLDSQRNDFFFLTQQGADFVAGTQAHFPQTYEFSGDALIHYGIGNVFFDQPFWATVRFNLDQLFIYDGKLMFVDVYPGIIEDQGRPRPMTPEERQNFLFILFSQYGNF